MYALCNTSTVLPIKNQNSPSQLYQAPIDKMYTLLQNPYVNTKVIAHIITMYLHSSQRSITFKLLMPESSDIPYTMKLLSYIDIFTVSMKKTSLKIRNKNNNSKPLTVYTVSWN